MVFFENFWSIKTSESLLNSRIPEFQKFAFFTSKTLQIPLPYPLHITHISHFFSKRSTHSLIRLTNLSTTSLLRWCPFGYLRKIQDIRGSDDVWGSISGIDRIHIRHLPKRRLHNSSHRWWRVWRRVSWRTLTELSGSRQMGSYSTPWIGRSLLTLWDWL